MSFFSEKTIIHVTEHARLRWRQRASKYANDNIEEIIKAVKNSKIIDKNEPLPYGFPKKDNSVYTIKDNVVFVFDPLDKFRFKLVTIIVEFNGITKRKRERNGNIYKKNWDFPRKRQEIKKSKKNRNFEIFEECL